ncbi:DUF3397 domain-containing protein [Lederbergia lenta]|uniref:DUF3397 domain-containing protein n=1 Tax=Lederbergia lenta TaxID=1467 RepID=UPI00203F7E96|nr:DUF3397 domain-containing protein [Lederbergia lenta]MCM3110248.1 DUF3397 domain-containing protein [Lederbergia lenta]
MKIIFSIVAATFITLPILLYLVIFIGMKYWTKNGKRAMNTAINFTTPILIFSVHILFMTIWSYSFIGYIIMFMLLIAVIFTYIYWRMREEIIYHKLFLGYWRLIFLLFMLIYLVLVIYGVLSRAIEAVISR